MGKIKAATQGTSHRNAHVYSADGDILFGLAP
jgi:hypothetical protein